VWQVHVDQPLVVAVSRTVPPGATLPPPLDAAAQLLLRPGLIPAVTCHAAAAAVCQSVSAHHVPPLTVNTSCMLPQQPLGVVVSSDVVAASLGKVRQLSPEMAKNLLQQTGQ